MTLRIAIPGVPVAQGRGRAVRVGSGIRVFDPEKSRSWKGSAQVHMLQARNGAGVHAPFVGALSLVLLGWWPRPKSMSKKDPAACYRPSLPDADNFLKCVLDAGNSVLWEDDRQIVRAVVEKWTCRLGDSPGVEIAVETIVAGNSPAREWSSS